MLISFWQKSSQNWQNGGHFKKKQFLNLKFKTQKPLEIERNGHKFGITDHPITAQHFSKFQKCQNFMYCWVLYCWVFYCWVFYCRVFYCRVFYFWEMYFWVMYCWVMYCRVLFENTKLNYYGNALFLCTGTKTGW